MLSSTNIGVCQVFIDCMATPTAAASYMMVRAMGGNASLAASIIAMTTVASLFTTSFGLVAMKALQWI